jgi:hypothetical protein
MTKKNKTSRKASQVFTRNRAIPVSCRVVYEDSEESLDNYLFSRGAIIELLGLSDPTIRKYLKKLEIYSDYKERRDRVTILDAQRMFSLCHFYLINTGKTNVDHRDFLAFESLKVNQSAKNYFGKYPAITQYLKGKGIPIEERFSQLLTQWRNSHGIVNNREKRLSEVRKGTNFTHREREKSRAAS